MSYGDYQNGYWVNGCWVPYYPTTYVWPQPVQHGWQCPGCKTYYSPTMTACTCERDKCDKANSDA